MNGGDSECRMSVALLRSKAVHIKGLLFGNKLFQSFVIIIFIQGQNELKEVANRWKQECHLMAYFKDTWEPKPKDFLSKFVSGSE